MSSTTLQANEKLNATNYHQWKFRIKLVLMKEGLWKLVDGKRKEPISGKSDNTEEIMKWEADNESAFATLCLAISDSQMIHVRDCETAPDVWRKLKKVYEEKGVARELYLRRKMSNLKMEEGTTMQDHINELMDIVDRLAGVGEVLTDRSIAMSLLDSLPRTYDMLKVSLGNTPDIITADLVKTRALQEEAQLNEESRKETGENAALVSKTKDNSKSWKNKGKTPNTYGGHKAKCFHCGKVGHKKVDCWILHPEKKGKPTSKPNKKELNEGKTAMI